jgi:hypothetical protein
VRVCVCVCACVRHACKDKQDLSVQVFTKVIQAQQHFVHKAYTKFYPNRTATLENAIEISLLLRVNYGSHYADFLEAHRRSNFCGHVYRILCETTN